MPLPTKNQLRKEVSNMIRGLPIPWNESRTYDAGEACAHVGQDGETHRWTRLASGREASFDESLWIDGGVLSDDDAKTARADAVRLIRKKRSLMDPGAENAEAEAEKDVRLAFRYIAQVQPGNMTSEEFQDAAGVLIRAFDRMAEDDPDPTVIDKKKVRAKIRALAENTSTPEDISIAAFRFLRVNLGSVRDSDPSQVDATAQIAALASVDLTDPEAVSAAIASIDSIAAVLTK